MVIKIFILDLLKRYENKYLGKKNLKEDLLNNKLEMKEEDLIEYKELGMIKRKINNKETLTKCDEIILDIIANKNTFTLNGEAPVLEDIATHNTHIVVKEIVRLKSLLESKISYESFVENIHNFSFSSKITEDIVEINNFKENIKEDSIFIGKKTEINKLSLSNLFKGAKEGDVILSNREENNTLLIASDYNMSSSSLIESFLLEPLIRKETVFYADFKNDCSIPSRISKLLLLSDHKSKLIFLSHDEFLSLSLEKINYYITKNKVVFIQGLALEKCSNLDIEKVTTKLKYMINIAGKANKEKAVNIFLPDIREVLNERNKYSIDFMNIFINNEIDNYNKTNIFMGTELAAFSYPSSNENKYFFRSIKNIIITGNTVCNDFPSYIFMFEDFENQEALIKTLKSLCFSEFIYLKQGFVKKVIPKCKFYFANLKSNSELDLNE